MSNDSLERLLKLKRLEEPPPGHLDRLSSRIIAQIEADNALSTETVWSRLLGYLDFKPVLACAYSAAAMGLLIVGLGMKNDLEPSQMIQQQPIGGIRLSSVPELENATEVRATSFRLPSTASLWRDNKAPAWNHTNSSSIHPVVHSSISPGSLRAQFLRRDQNSPTAIRRQLLTRPASYSP
jgi:hypothetical protein